jgi:hypothetical protein
MKVCDYIKENAQALVQKYSFTVFVDAQSNIVNYYSGSSSL